MADAAPVRYTTCGAEVPGSDTAELENHAGHDLHHVDPGGASTA